MRHRPCVLSKPPMGSGAAPASEGGRADKSFFIDDVVTEYSDETACPIVGSATFLKHKSSNFYAFRQPHLVDASSLGGFEWSV